MPVLVCRNLATVKITEAEGGFKLNLFFIPFAKINVSLELERNSFSWELRTSGYDKKCSYLFFELKFDLLSILHLVTSDRLKYVRCSLSTVGGEKEQP